MGAEAVIETIIRGDNIEAVSAFRSLVADRTREMVLEAYRNQVRKAPAPVDHDRATNAGEDVDGVQKVGADKGGNSRDDMEAFDQFGPKTRDVLNHRMPVKWSAYQTLQAVRRAGMDPRLPHIDDKIANQLLQHAAMVSRHLQKEELETYRPVMEEVLADLSR